MIIESYEIGGEIDAPPSKSYSHRALIGAALLREESVINNVTLSNDILDTLKLVELLGKKFIIEGRNIKLRAGRKLKKGKDIQLIINESATTLRIAIPLLLKYYPNQVIKIKIKENLAKRPLTTYEKIFRKNKILFERRGTTVILKGTLSAKSYVLENLESSQYISGFLFAFAQSNQQLIVKGKVPSANYVLMTKEVLSLISNFKKNPAKQVFKYEIEGDFSNSAFYLIGGLLTTQHLAIKGLNLASLQGDAKIIELLKRMGNELKLAKDRVEITRGRQKEIIIDLDPIPDLGPILFILAARINNGLKFINYQRLAIKESNRLQVMQENLENCGYIFEYKNQTLQIKKNKKQQSDNQIIAVKATGDHRIAMSLAILQIDSNLRIDLDDPNVVAKSYPNFWEDLAKIRR